MSAGTPTSVRPALAGVLAMMAGDTAAQALPLRTYRITFYPNAGMAVQYDAMFRTTLEACDDCQERMAIDGIVTPGTIDAIPLAEWLERERQHLAADRAANDAKNDGSRDRAQVERLAREELNRPTFHGSRT